MRRPNRHKRKRDRSSRSRFDFVLYLYFIKPEKFKCIAADISVRVKSAIYKEKLERKVDRFWGEPLLTG